MSGMVLNFQRRFVDYIRDGSKTTTIRGERKDERRPKPGDMLHLWTGLRQKGAEFILRAPCIRTEDFEIYGPPDWAPIAFANKIGVRIAGELLSDSHMDSLAWRDGFRYHDSVVPGCPKYTADPSGCFCEMLEFWRGRLPFKGWITHWDFSKAQFERAPKGTQNPVETARRLVKLLDEINVLESL